MKIKAKTDEELKQMRADNDRDKRVGDVKVLYIFLAWVSLAIGFLFYVNFPQAFWTILIVWTIYLAISTGLTVRTIRNIK
jgi:hypothetical protein